MLTLLELFITPTIFDFFRAEEEFYEHLGLGFGFNYFMERGIWLPRTQIFCQYKSPSRIGDTLEISLTVKEIREKSVKYGFIAKKMDTDVLVAESYVAVIAADRKIGEAI